ncbi:MAG: MBL fold metallo-hydrolase [Phycisphaerae bacterium]|nr:MBL fold metallo-hydrolase [Phycisphaerae bacterium]
MSNSAGAPRAVEFLFLGTGTSSGVPVIGCSCAVCTSTDPRDRRLRCGAALRYTDHSGAPRVILIDTPPDHREQSLRHRFDRCDAIVYTHNHVDHTFGLDDVRRYNAMMRQPIDTWGDEHTLEHLKRVYAHIFDRHKNVNDSFVADLIPRLVPTEGHFVVHGLRFTPLPLLHGRLPVLGYRVEAVDASGAIALEQPGPLPLGYCTDVNAIPPATWRKLQGLRTLVLDMLRYRAHPTHFTVDEAIDTAERIGASSTYFIHMTHDIRHAELDPLLPKSMALAFDGLALK